MRTNGRIYARGQWWWMGFRVSIMKAGKVRRVEVREPTHVAVAGKATERQAWGVLRARLRQVDRAEWVGTMNEKLTVADLLNAYSTLRMSEVRNPGGMRYALTFLQEAFGVIRASALLPEDVDAWRNRMKTTGYAEGTIDRIARVLRAAYNLALRDRKVAFVPRITCFNPDDARQGFIEYPEFAAIRNALQARDPAVADMWIFGYYSGRRPSEIEALQWTAISTDQRTATIERSKNRRPWVVALEGPLWEVIERRLAARRAEELLVPWVFHHEGKKIDHGRRNKVFGKAKVAAGYPTRIFYDLRRTAARDMINAGVDATTTMNALGHTTRAMLDRYGIRTVEDQRRAVRRLVEVREGNRAQNGGHAVVSLDDRRTADIPR